MQDLKGKIALVTGGAKGVGKVIAHKLAARGAHVIINFFHSLSEAKATRDELLAVGAQVEIVRASVARQDQVARMFDEIEQRHGHLDILVNNAAAGAMVPMSEVTEEFFDRALGTNLKGAFWCAQRAAALMQKRGGGIIVNLSSIGSFLAIPNYTVVGTSKAALEALTRYLAAEFAPLNIRVNAASAGMVDTDVIKNFPDHVRMREQSVRSTPTGRGAAPEDLADVVMFLTTDASRWIVGQTILADGGISLGTSAFVPPDGLNYVKPRVPAPQSLAPTAQATRAAPAQRAASGTQIAVLPQEATAIQPTPAPLAAAARPSLSLVETPTSTANVAVDSEDIAIIGIGLALPGAKNAEEYWDVLMRGAELFETVPGARWRNENFYSPDPATEDKNYSRHSAFVKGFPATDGELTDGSVRWLRHSLKQAMDSIKQNAQDRIAFVVGYTADGNQCLEESHVTRGISRRLHEILDRMPGDATQRAQLVAAIDRRLQARYPAGTASPAEFLPYVCGRKAMAGLLPETTQLLMVDTACSSSLYAVDIGVKGLLTGKCDVAVCGGAFSLAPMNGVLFSKLGGFARGGAVRSLDKTGDGVLFSDGAGVVVLKRLQRARQDGDKIYGVVKAFASSSDGRGKAIYAPAIEGQKLALRRAHAHPAYRDAKVDWVLAHATGTPTGDRTELEALRSSFPADHKFFVTSNKSVIGHTGWAAGVASLIQAVLAFEHKVIPPQHRFTAPPAEFPISSSSISIPREPQPWPRTGVPRHAAISSFGFGGTNAHLLVGEHDPVVAPSTGVKRPYSERIALVAWAAHVPGLHTTDAIEQWMRDAGARPEESFGASYPTPAFEQVRMPPKTIRTVDRTQLMILACAQTLLRERLGSFWESTRETTGVFLGHMGKTRQAIAYSYRIYLDDIQRTLAEDPAIANSPSFEAALSRLREAVKHDVPPANEDSFPGGMPNVIPARVASFFDLKGLTLACDAGFASGLVAFELGARYLHSGELDLAIVGGINGNSGVDAKDTLRGLGLPDHVAAGEGAFLFALTRESTARERGLPILAYVNAAADALQSEATVDCGMPATGERLNYMGADSAWGVLRALLGSEQTMIVRCRNGSGSGEHSLYMERPDPAGGAPRKTNVVNVVDVVAAVPPARATAQPQTRLEPVLSRTSAYWETMPAETIGASTPWLAAGTVLLTDAPELVEALGTMPEDVVVLSSTPLPAPRARWHHISRLDAAAVASLLAPYPEHRHLRVVADLDASAPSAHARTTQVPSLMVLSDLLLLTLQSMYERLTTAESTFISLFLGAWQNGTPHAMSGVFSGMIKSAWLELGPAFTYGVFTSTRDVRQAVQEIQSESSLRRMMPVVGYDGGRRIVLRTRDENYLRISGEPLNEHSLVLAVGGGRGIAAEILKDLARRYRPQICLVGSNDVSAYPEATFSGSDEAFARSRPEFLRSRKAQHPQATIASINAEFDRMVNARATRRNLEALAAICGAGKVRYAACNVLDRDRLATVIGELVPQKATIDLVLHVAGINRSASLHSKTLEAFRSVRDLKVLGYQNLRRALRDRKLATWVNFGSFIGFTGQIGEIDYAAGNDFLNTASAAGRGNDQGRELTICWGVWGEVGMVESHPLGSAFTKGSGRYTNMPTAEGLMHFHEELCNANAASSVVLMGDMERRSIMARIPSFFDAPRSSLASASQTGRFYLDRVVHNEPDRIVFERTFSIERDTYLHGHVVNGHPTLPGTFVSEIAAEAALTLIPQMKVVALEDLRFEHFLRVYGNAKAPKRIEARVLERSAERAVVSVRVLTDVLAPNGHVLTRDKLHFSARVILMPQYAQAPMWEHWDSAGEFAVPDPYHFDKAPVMLRGVLETTRDTRIHPMGMRAAYATKLHPGDPTFSQFLMPCLMMDGLARVGALHLVADDYLPVAAPASIRRVDFYQGGNDCVLTSSQPAGSIQLYVTPTGMVFGRSEPESRCVAVAADGRMLLQMKGLSGTIIGYVHRRTGEFITPPAMERLVSAGPSQVASPERASAGVAPVTRVRWHPIPLKPVAASAPGRLAGSNVLVVGGSKELAAAVVQRLQLLGASVARFEDQTQISEDLHGVVDLSPCGPLPAGEERPWEPLLDRSVRVLKALWEPWSREATADRIFYMPVTALGGLMGYDGTAVALPYGGIWAGFAKSLPREIPNCNVKVLDVADTDPDVVANLVADELGTWDLFEVGYRAGQRYGLLAVNEAAGAPQLSIGKHDTILISGGGRGIGFGVAEALARRTGCRVVVTGRSALPASNEPWLSMADEDFRAFSADRLKAGAAARNVAGVKTQLETLTQIRALWRNLSRVRAAGLRIDYAVCDFNSRTEVQALVDALGSALTGVIHNAGIDTPVRLSAKSAESFVATVRVKVAGFLNLLRALADADLKFFCNVGSIAGRLGGMAGQTDYAAGNDGLARLGFWAQSNVKFPVKTICWPTWHNLGLIANFDAAVKYMSAVDVEQGVTLWVDEILQGGKGEIGYPGRPGRAVSPLELKGFRLVTPEFPNFEALYSRSIYLGTILEYRRFRSMRTRASIDPRTTPMLQEFLVGEQPAVPVSMLLEYAAAVAADEIVPENWPSMRLREIKNCTFEIAGLKLPAADTPFVFDREASGRWHAKRWVVEVNFVDPAAARSFGRVQFIFEKDDQPPAAQPKSITAIGVEPATIDNARGLAWRSLVLDGGRWMRTAAAELTGELRNCLPTDVWAHPYVARMRLPGHLIEGALRAITWETAQAGGVLRIGFDRLRFLADGMPVRIVGKVEEATFAFVDNSNTITHVFEKIAVLARVSQNKKVATA